MLTLNQIKTKLIEYFNGHAQVNDVKYEDDFEFKAESNLTYPVVNIEYLDSNISNKLMNYNFKVVIADVVSEDRPELQDEIYSDTLLIAEDFFTFLQYQEGWTFSKSSSLQKFWDENGDRVCGIVFRVVLSVVRPQAECTKPSKI